MASLSISTACKPYPFLSTITKKPLKPQTFSFKPIPPPQINAISSSSPRLNTELGLGLGLSPFPSATQAPATATRGAEGDVMGLLLKERIIFLGNQIDDFVADAIISQLLLLDAQDHTKDIRLFINSPGGSLRYGFSLSFPLYFIRVYYYYYYYLFFVIIIWMNIEQYLAIVTYNCLVEQNLNFLFALLGCNIQREIWTFLLLNLISYERKQNIGLGYLQTKVGLRTHS